MFWVIINKLSRKTFAIHTHNFENLDTLAKEQPMSILAAGQKKQEMFQNQ